MSKLEFILEKSPLYNKKYRIIYNNGHIDFGAKGYEDYTIHKDDKRKNLYISRHKKREKWDKDGIYTAGFWSRWLLWNKKTIKESIEDIEKQNNIIIRKR